MAMEGGPEGSPSPALSSMGMYAPYAPPVYLTTIAPLIG